jgi:proline iminopeptidase
MKRDASSTSVPRESRIQVGNAALFCREIGEGPPLIVLHGGPDFDHRYLIPDLDRLSDSFRLIYYDQRGRGRSAENVRPEDISIRSDVEDLERLRKHLRLDSVAILGHSWGGLLALEYAVRHAHNLSHLVLLSPAPASREDYQVLRQDRRTRWGPDIAEMETRAADARYQAGDPDAVADYYRVHFRSTLRQPKHLDYVIQRLRSSFTQKGIVKARAVEDRLMQETWLAHEYDLLPELEPIRIPTLIIHGEHDLIPAACAERIAHAIPTSRFVLLHDCGHFSYLERPELVHQEVCDFFAVSSRTPEHT